MIDGQRHLETARQYLGTVGCFCRRCRDVELFDKFAITSQDLLTNETLTRRVKICMGCGYEMEE